MEEEGEEEEEVEKQVDEEEEEELQPKHNFNPHEIEPSHASPTPSLCLSFPVKTTLISYSLDKKNASSEQKKKSIRLLRHSRNAPLILLKSIPHPISLFSPLFPSSVC